MIYSVCRLLSRWFLVVCFRVRTFGTENVPSAGGFLLACNHESYLDPLAAGSSILRPVHYMAKESLFRNPLIGAFLRGVLAFPVRREAGDTRAIKSAMRLVRSGKGVLLFPGGTRGSRNAQPGIGFLAAKLGVPVVAVFISGTDKAFPRGAKFFRPARVTVRYGKPFTVDPALPYQQIADSIMAEIERLK